MSISFLTDTNTAIILAVLFSRAKSATYSVPMIGITLNLAGTFLHELSHYAVAVLTNAQPNSFSLIPKEVSPNRWVLGNVQVSNAQWYNVLPVASAPLILLVVAFNVQDWYRLYYGSGSIIGDLICLFVMVLLIENAIPSWQDIEVALSSTVGLIFYALLFSSAYFLQSFPPIF